MSMYYHGSCDPGDIYLRNISWQTSIDVASMCRVRRQGYGRSVALRQQRFACNRQGDTNTLSFRRNQRTGRGRIYTKKKTTRYNYRNIGNYIEKKITVVPNRGTPSHELSPSKTLLYVCVIHIRTRIFVKRVNRCAYRIYSVH